jgi:SAM-dependent methyltransferase
VLQVKVWTYWEGPRTPLVGLCMETLRRHFRAVVLDRPAFDAMWTEDRDIDLERLYVAHRADFVRAYLLRHYGGIWVDADCIAQCPLDELEPMLGRYELVAYREPAGGITNNFLYGRAGSDAVRAFYDAVLARLRAGGPLQWLELGGLPLTRVFGETAMSTALLPTARIMPICWSRSERFLLDEQHHEDKAAPPFCYMLSNHSLPAWATSASRSELLCSPTLIGRLLRRALSQQEEEAMSQLAPNYAYWQQSGGEWNAEYDRRKTRHAFYHLAETMLTDYFLHHAPCRVLEFGCGPGRHLRNLVDVPGADVHGFDQSASMIAGGFGWADEGWLREHVRVGDATGRLPWPDAHFDIVYTSEALLHTRPEDLEGRLQELRRVCRGHLLHLEPPPTWRGHSTWHDGCWGHDLVAAYGAIATKCVVLKPGFSRQVPYRAIVETDSVRWTWSPAMLAIYRRMDAALEQGFETAGIEKIA